MDSSSGSSSSPASGSGTKVASSVTEEGNNNIDKINENIATNTATANKYSNSDYSTDIEAEVDNNINDDDDDDDNNAELFQTESGKGLVLHMARVCDKLNEMLPGNGWMTIIKFNFFSCFIAQL